MMKLGLSTQAFSPCRALKHSSAVLVGAKGRFESQAVLKHQRLGDTLASGPYGQVTLDLGQMSILAGSQCNWPS